MDEESETLRIAQGNAAGVDGVVNLWINGQGIDAFDQTWRQRRLVGVGRICVPWTVHLQASQKLGIGLIPEIGKQLVPSAGERQRIADADDGAGARTTAGGHRDLGTCRVIGVRLPFDDPLAIAKAARRRPSVVGETDPQAGGQSTERHEGELVRVIGVVSDEGDLEVARRRAIECAGAQVLRSRRVTVAVPANGNGAVVVAGGGLPLVAVLARLHRAVAALSGATAGIKVVTGGVARKPSKIDIPEGRAVGGAEKSAVAQLPRLEQSTIAGRRATGGVVVTAGDVAHEASGAGVTKTGAVHTPNIVAVADLARLGSTVRALRGTACGHVAVTITIACEADVIDITEGGAV